MKNLQPNARLLKLQPEEVDYIEVMRATYFRSTPPIQEFLESRYPGRRILDVAEIGGLQSGGLAVSTQLRKEIYIVVENTDGRIWYEKSHWPYFRLSI